jgi:hypothetical protein
MNFVSIHTETCLCWPPMIPLQNNQLKQVHTIVLTFGIFVSTVTTYLNVVTHYFCLSTLFRFWTCDCWTEDMLNIKLLDLKYADGIR